MTEEVPAYLSPKEAVQRLKDQGAVISIAHPFDRRGNAPWEWEELVELVPMLDAVEVFNARVLTPEINNKAKAFADEFGLANAAGSDAHSLGEIGAATLTLPAFETADEFRAALKSAEIHGHLSCPADLPSCQYGKEASESASSQRKNLNQKPAKSAGF